MNISDHRDEQLDSLHEQRREELLLSQKPYNMSLLPENSTTKRLDQLADMVNRPSHYTSGSIECIQAIKAALTPEEYKGYLKGNVLKYNWRCNLKNGVEDLKKAQTYLAWLIAEYEAAK